jgi:hypothetical protein
MRKKFGDENRKNSATIRDIIEKLSSHPADSLAYDYNQQELYFLVLSKKSTEEIQNLVNEERSKERKEELEKGFFFDQPSADANFQEWYRMPDWSIEEAVALSLGKDPKIVNPDSLDNYSNYNHNFNSYHKGSTLYKDYKLRMETLIRFINAKKVSTHPTPLEFVTWAQENDFYIPEELKNLIHKRWVISNDSKTENETLQEEFQKIKSLYEELKKQPIKEENEEKLNPKVKTSLHTLILVMAIEKYRYNPESEKNISTTNIRSAVERYGLKIDDNTIRARLDEAYNELKTKMTLKKVEN